MCYRNVRDSQRKGAPLRFRKFAAARLLAAIYAKRRRNVKVAIVGVGQLIFPSLGLIHSHR